MRGCQTANWACSWTYSKRSAAGRRHEAAFATARGKLLGHDQLASQLNTAPSLLQAWMTGQATMPDRKLIALADILDEISTPKS